MNVDLMKQDVVSKIREFFTENGICIGCNSFEDCILQWLDICDKRITPKKRKVVFSKELQNKINKNLIDYETRRLIYIFKLKFEEGKDICPYLSRNIKIPTFIDYLLTIWRIHHLHLTEEMNGDMSKRSDKYILFIIHKEVVYFLDQTRHLSGKEFASRYLLDILDSNDWLDFIFVNRSSKIKSIEYEITSDEEMYNFWKSNLNYCVYKIGNSFYININGLTTGGNSLQNQLSLCKINKAIFNLSQSNEVSYGRTEIDSKMMRLTIYCRNKDVEYKCIEIEGE